MLDVGAQLTSLKRDARSEKNSIANLQMGEMPTVSFEMIGAEGGIRAHTTLRSTDFKNVAEGTT
jgi:hypothetical protein